MSPTLGIMFCDVCVLLFTDKLTWFRLRKCQFRKVLWVIFNIFMKRDSFIKRIYQVKVLKLVILQMFLKLYIFFMKIIDIQKKIKLLQMRYIAIYRTHLDMHEMVVITILWKWNIFYNRTYDNNMIFKVLYFKNYMLENKMSFLGIINVEHWKWIHIKIT